MGRGRDSEIAPTEDGYFFVGGNSDSRLLFIPAIFERTLHWFEHYVAALWVFQCDKSCPNNSANS